MDEAQDGPSRWLQTASNQSLREVCSWSGLPGMFWGFDFYRLAPMEMSVASTASFPREDRWRRVREAGEIKDKISPGDVFSVRTPHLSMGVPRS